MDFLKKATVPTIIVELILIIILYALGYYKFKKVDEKLSQIEETNNSLNSKIIVLDAKHDSHTAEIARVAEENSKLRDYNKILSKRLDLYEDTIKSLFSELKTKDSGYSFDKLVKKMDKMKNKLNKKNKKKNSDDYDDEGFLKDL